MNTWTLVRRSLRHHARAHAGVVLGAAIGSAALVGALVVGDSVRESVRRRAFERIGAFSYAVAPEDRFFEASLAEKLVVDPAVGLKPVASLLVLPGVVT